MRRQHHRCGSFACFDAVHSLSVVFHILFCLIAVPQHDITSGELILSMPPLKESCFGIAWNPKSHMLAWVGDERNAANAPILSLLAPAAK
jgi:hypothetical protein